MANWNDGHGRTELTSNLPAPASGNDQLTELRFREPVVNLHAEEQVRVPEEFGNLHRGFLARIFNFVYNPFNRKTFKDYEQRLAVAGKVDKGWTRPNLPSNAYRHARS